ncbi:MAG: PKD domain-containing protein, partial [Bacteroidia bacterium]
TTAGAITPIVSAPGQPITIQFTSDVSAVGPGFAFQAVYTGTCLTCTIPVAGTASAATATYCNSGATTIAATGYSEGTGTRYQWESSTDNFATAGVAIGSVANSYSSLSTGTITTTTSYRLKVFCIANPGDVSYSSVATVTINFPGTIAPITGAGICAGQSATLTAVSAGALSFDWTASGGYTNTGSSITVSPAVTTTYTVTGTTMGGCTGSATITVTVNPILNLSIIGDTILCYGNSVNLTAIASGGNGGPYFFNWSPASGLNVSNSATVTASPNVTTTYTVSVSDNCGTPMRSEQVTVIVNPLPVVSFMADTLSGCVPVTVNFTNLSPTSFACAWDFGDNTYSNTCNPTHSFNQVGTYPISLTVTDANGCVNTQGGININVY